MVFSQEIALGTGASISFDVGTSINIDGLKLIPSANFTLSGFNSVTKSDIPVVIGQNESIAVVFNNINSVDTFSGDLILYYEDDKLNGIIENNLVLEVRDSNGDWINYNAIKDPALNSLTQTFNSPINFLSVTASSFDATLPVDDFNKNNTFSFYPNPVNTQLNISTTNEDLTFEIFDLLGKKLLKSTKKTIDFSSYSQGLYILKVTNSQSNTSFTKKILKQ